MPDHVCRWCVEVRDELVREFMKQWDRMESANAEKRKLTDTAALRSVARGRRVIASTTSGASKQRCAVTNSSRSVLALAHDDKEARRCRRRRAVQSCSAAAGVFALAPTASACCRDVLEALPITTVILEEAAEILEAHVLAALPAHADRCIQIGDHKQLRGKVNSYILQVRAVPLISLPTCLSPQWLMMAMYLHIRKLQTFCASGL
jgi:AAA domain